MRDDFLILGAEESCYKKMELGLLSSIQQNASADDVVHITKRAEEREMRVNVVKMCLMCISGAVYFEAKAVLKGRNGS